MTESNIMPREVVGLYDSGAQWADRYRVVIESLDGGVYAIVTGEQGNYPNAVFMTTEETALECLGGERGVTWDELPEPTRRSIVTEVEGYARGGDA